MDFIPSKNIHVTNIFKKINKIIYIHARTHTHDKKKAWFPYVKNKRGGELLFGGRNGNGQEGGEEICLASIDLWEVGSGAFNNTTQRLVFQGDFWASLSLKNTQLGLQHVIKFI